MTTEEIKKDLKDRVIKAHEFGVLIDSSGVFSTRDKNGLNQPIKGYPACLLTCCSFGLKVHTYMEGPKIRYNLTNKETGDLEVGFMGYKSLTNNYMRIGYEIREELIKEGILRT